MWKTKQKFLSCQEVNFDLLHNTLSILLIGFYLTEILTQMHTKPSQLKARSLSQYCASLLSPPIPHPIHQKILRALPLRYTSRIPLLHQQLCCHRSTLSSFLIWTVTVASQGSSPACAWMHRTRAFCLMPLHHSLPSASPTIVQVHPDPQRLRPYAAPP